MDVIFKASACAVIAVILGLTISRQGKDYGILLTLVACCMMAWVAFRYLEPVLDLFTQLQELGQLNVQMMQILLKVLGISLISQITCLICTDAGNSALAKALQILTAAVILWLSLPLYNGLLELIKEILEEI